MIGGLASEGYSVKKVCEVLSYNRSRYYRQIGKLDKGKKKGNRQKEESELRGRIRQICLEHPSWGTRRVRVWLNRREGHPGESEAGPTNHA